MPITPTLTRGLAVVGLVVALTAGSALLPSGDETSPTGEFAAATTTGAGLTPTADLATQIEQLQTHLAAQPEDARGWAALALTLIEQARVTADPLLYAQAESSAARSLEVTPAENDLGLAAQATLATAQHRFSRALQLANRALAVNPYSAPALAVRVDALTELGRASAALRAAQKMDAVQPGLAATTRLAYQAELRGRQRQAQRLFHDASTAISAPAALAFVEYHLGELARERGEFTEAMRHYRAANAALPGDVNAAAGRAAVLAADGDIERAVRILRNVVSRVPLPQHLIALGELFELQGDEVAAQEQYAVVEAAIALADAGGVRADLELAQFEADHGDPAAALVAARQEWQRRQAPPVADAMAWSLHSLGRDRRALPFAEKAVQLGGDARAWQHLGAIQAELGQTRQARESLRKALQLDRGYAPWQLAELRTVLRSLAATS